MFGERLWCGASIGCATVRRPPIEADEAPPRYAAVPRRTEPRARDGRCRRNAGVCAEPDARGGTAYRVGVTEARRKERDAVRTAGGQPWISCAVGSTWE